MDLLIVDCEHCCPPKVKYQNNSKGYGVNFFHRYFSALKDHSKQKDSNSNIVITRLYTHRTKSACECLKWSWHLSHPAALTIILSDFNCSISTQWNYYGNKNGVKESRDLCQKIFSLNPLSYVLMKIHINKMCQRFDFFVFLFLKMSPLLEME